jgi:hypothetical protein
VDNSADISAAWNPLALTSFLLSLVFPVGAAVLQLSGGLFQPVNASTPPAYHVGVALLLAATVSVPVAILAGHAALDRARCGAHRQPLRRVAIVALVLGYGSLVTYLGGIVLTYYLLVTHPRFHIVG